MLDYRSQTHKVRPEVAALSVAGRAVAVLCVLDLTIEHTIFQAGGDIGEVQSCAVVDACGGSRGDPFVGPG